MPGRANKVDRDVAKLSSIPKELVTLFLTGPMMGEAVNAAAVAFKMELTETSLDAKKAVRPRRLSASYGWFRRVRPLPVTTVPLGHFSKVAASSGGIPRQLISLCREPHVIPTRARYGGVIVTTGG